MYYLYVIYGYLTSNDAMSLRVQTFCKILNDLGEEVIVISIDKQTPYIFQKHNGISYISIREKSDAIFSRLQNYFFFKRRLKKLIAKLETQLEIKGIFFYDIPPNAVSFLKKKAQANKFKIFHDSVEWYSPEQFILGKLSPSYALKDFLNRFLIDKQVSVFAISKYLYSYFVSKGIVAMRIPIMVDINEVSSKKSSYREKLVLAYAGSPGRKDYLKEMIEGFSDLNINELQRVNFHIIGRHMWSFFEDDRWLWD